MDPGDLARRVETIIFRLLAEIENLLQPHVLFQFGILIACLAAAHVASRIMQPRLEAQIKAMPDKRISRLRVPVFIVNRLRLILFVAMTWLALIAMRTVTWPSRSYYVGLVAGLATAWLVVTVASRLIRNRPLRTVVKWSAWLFFVLIALGLSEDAAAVLDNAAIQFGEVRLSLLLLLKAIVTLAILLTVAGLLVRLITGRLEAVEDISPSMRVLSDKLIRVLLFGTAIVFGLQSIGFDLTSITVLSGAIGLGLGFGLQKVVSNLVSGVILLIDKSIKPGDVISLGETFGWISSLGARYVSVVTRDGKEYLIPNEDLITGQVVNWSHSNDLVRLDIHFGVAYQSDPHEVRRVAREAAATVNRVVEKPQPVCHIVGFGDSSLDLILRFWIRDPSAGITNVRGDVYLALWDALKANGIEIPYPRREVTVLGDVKMAK